MAQRNAIVRKLHAGGASVAVHHRASGGEADSLICELNAMRTGSAAAFASPSPKPSSRRMPAS